MVDERRHPDAERLAEYVDGVLEAEARAEVERHLTDCASCRAVVMETMAFTETETAARHAQTARVLPFRSRRWLTGVAAGLAVAAALVLTVRVLRPEWLSGLFGPRGDRPELQELIAAVANEPTRPVEGRLSGGFKYAPPPLTTRGAGEQAFSPAILGAVSKLRGADSDHPQTRAAQGVADLVAGGLDDAISKLKAATVAEPGNSAFHSDLSAALATRAMRLNRDEDWFNAVRTSEAALRLAPGNPEALFNHAIALEGHGQREDAKAAWERFLAADNVSQWAAEARRRLQALIEVIGRRPQRIEMHPISELDAPLVSRVPPRFGNLGPQVQINLGSPREPTEFPASFWHYFPRTMCSATLVGPNTILVAGHCLHATDEVRVHLASAAPVDGTCMRHENFDPDPQRLSNDLGICILNGPVANITYETVSTAPVDQSRVLLLTGFGCDGLNFEKKFRSAFAGIDRSPSANDDHIVAKGLSSACIDPDNLVVRCNGETAASLCDGDSGGASYLLLPQPANRSSPEEPSVEFRRQVAVNSWANSGSHRSGLTSLATRSAIDFLNRAISRGAQICGMTPNVSGCR